MPDCPKCRQPVDSQALECPACRTILKAYGHPGMPLFRASGDQFLCLSCVYHADDTCNFPKRPHAKDCTLYRDLAQRAIAQSPDYTITFQLKGWLKRNLSWILVAGLLLISLLLALLR